MVDAELRAVVVDLLGKRWSPEQVAHELHELFADQSARRLCAESIYQAIYDPDAPSPAQPSAAVDAGGVASKAWNDVGG